MKKLTAVRPLEKGQFVFWGRDVVVAGYWKRLALRVRRWASRSHKETE